MKRKITKILGVVLTLSLLVSLAVTTAVPASAANDAWSTYATPSGTGLVIDVGNQWTGPFAIDIAGTAIYAASDVGGAGAASLVKSTDGGRTWTALSLTPNYSGWASVASTITDIVCSSIDANTIYVTDGYDIYKSIDAGATWVVLSNLFGSIPAGPGLITSIDVGYIGTAPYIFAAVSSYGFGTGGVFVAEEAVYGMPWSDLLIDTDRATAWGGGADVSKILVDPANFATSQMVMAVATDVDAASAAKVTTKYMGAQWSQNAPDITIPTVASWLVTSSVWLPADFSSNLASGLMQAFIGVASNAGTGSDVYLVQFGVPTGVVVDLNIGGPPGTTTNVYGLDGIGNAGSASLLAAGSVYPTANNTPRVFRSTDGGFTWLPDLKSPTGGQTAFPSPSSGTTHSILILDATTAIVGTHGADCAVSLSNDFGATWNGVSLATNGISAIDDFEPGSVFITTDNAADNVDAIWRSDGTNWERVFTESIYGPADMITRSADGSTLFAYITGAGSTIYRSVNDGQTWAPLVGSPTAQNVFMALDGSSLVAGGAGAIYTSPNGGVLWFTRTCAIGTITSLAVAPNGDMLAAGDNAGVVKIARSTNGGVTWTPVATAVPFTTGSAAIIAPAYDYATSGTVYVTGTDTGDNDAGVYSWTFGTSTAWARVDGTDPFDGTAGGNPEDVNNGVGIVTAPAVTPVTDAGMVYVADGSAAGEGISRIKGNRTVAEQMPDAGAAVVSMGLWYTPGSNTLWTIVGNAIRTYTDRLAVSGTMNSAAATSPTTGTATWAALTGATTYQVIVNIVPQTNVYVAANGAGVVVAVNNATQTATITGLAAGVTYSVSVWALTPVTSFLFDGAALAFSTPPTVPVPSGNLVPANGAINIPVLGPAFAWAAPAGVPGIIGYNWELSEDPLFGSFVEDGQKTLTVPYYVYPGSLEYETDYYWQVQAVTATGVSAWVTSVFTTVAEAEPPITVEPPPTPTITVTVPITTQPAPTITVEPPDVTVTVPLPATTITTYSPPDIILPEEETPAYIWAIVAIGAVLVIAVVVLIVRTRRVV